MQQHTRRIIDATRRAIKRALIRVVESDDAQSNDQTLREYTHTEHTNNNVRVDVSYRWTRDAEESSTCRLIIPERVARSLNTRSIWLLMRDAAECADNVVLMIHDHDPCATRVEQRTGHHNDVDPINDQFDIVIEATCFDAMS